MDVQNIPLGSYKLEVFFLWHIELLFILRFRLKFRSYYFRSYRMGVMLQTFHWDCPREDKQEFQWWNHINEQIPSLAKVEFTSLWLPPIHKAANLFGPSMAYYPYDYYNLA